MTKKISSGDGTTNESGLPSLRATPGSEEEAEIALTEMLIEDNRAMREAGCELAEAAIRVVREYDGCHRLMLAVSKWTTVVANEGGRQKIHSQNAEDTREAGQTLKTRGTQ